MGLLGVTRWILQIHHPYHTHVGVRSDFVDQRNFVNHFQNDSFKKKKSQDHSFRVLLTDLHLQPWLTWKWAQGASVGRTHTEREKSLMVIVCFPSLFALQHPSSCDWLTSLLIPSYHLTTSCWKNVHGVSLLGNNIALLVLLLSIRGEFRSPGQPSAVSNLHRDSGKTTEESQKEKDYYRNPWQHTEGARYGSSELYSLAPRCCSPRPPNLICGAYPIDTFW